MKLGMKIELRLHFRFGNDIHDKNDAQILLSRKNYRTILYLTDPSAT
jgi:hypothetical protein